MLAATLLHKTGTNIKHHPSVFQESAARALDSSAHLYVAIMLALWLLSGGLVVLAGTLHSTLDIGSPPLVNYGELRRRMQANALQKRSDSIKRETSMVYIQCSRCPIDTLSHLVRK